MLRSRHTSHSPRTCAPVIVCAESDAHGHARIPVGRQLLLSGEARAAERKAQRSFTQRASVASHSVDGHRDRCRQPKGGVAKTTSVHALGAALVEQDKQVLVVDLDPQASLTWAAGGRSRPTGPVDPRRHARAGQSHRRGGRTPIGCAAQPADTAPGVLWLERLTCGSQRGRSRRSARLPRRARLCRSRQPGSRWCAGARARGTGQPKGLSPPSRYRG